MECGFVPTVDPFKSTIGLSHVKPNLLGAHRRLIIFDVGCVKIIVESWSSTLVVCRDSNASGLNGDPTWLVPSMDRVFECILVGFESIMGFYVVFYYLNTWIGSGENKRLALSTLIRGQFGSEFIGFGEIYRDGKDWVQGGLGFSSVIVWFSLVDSKICHGWSGMR